MHSPCDVNLIDTVDAPSIIETVEDVCIFYSCFCCIVGKCVTSCKQNHENPLLIV